MGMAPTTIFLPGLVLHGPLPMLRGHPPAIAAAVPPKAESEKRQGSLLGMPFLPPRLILPFVSVTRLQETALLPLSLCACGIGWAFNIRDWPVPDWLVSCAITPKMPVSPAPEGQPDRKDHSFHPRGFLSGTVFRLIMGLIGTTAAFLIAWT